jgi:hypothetical protein
MIDRPLAFGEGDEFSFAQMRPNEKDVLFFDLHFVAIAKLFTANYSALKAKKSGVDNPYLLQANMLAIASISEIVYP